MAGSKSIRSRIPRIKIKFDIQTSKTFYSDYTLSDLRRRITREIFSRPNVTICSLCAIILISVSTLSLLTELSLDVALFGAVSCAGLFVALIIFKIQSFPAPVYHLSFKSLSKNRILAFIIIENSGITDFQGKFLIPKPPCTDYLALSHNISNDTYDSHVKFDSIKGHSTIVPIWTFNVNEERSSDISIERSDVRNSDFEFYVIPKAFMYNRMGGSKEICFSSLQIAPKMNEVISRINDPYFESTPIPSKILSSHLIYDIGPDSNDFSNATIID